MNDNLQITRVEQARDEKGTGVYFTFAYPVTADNLDGYIVLDNAAYLAAMKKGTVDDPNAGLYVACMTAIAADINPYLNTTTTTTTTTQEA